MRLKLIDVVYDSEKVQFGTCELCFYTGVVDNPRYIFEKENGDIVKIRGYYWEWGDYYLIDIGNIIDFADYISRQEFDDDTELDYDWLEVVSGKYRKETKQYEQTI